METDRIRVKTASAVLAAVCAFAASADDWRDLAWKGPVSPCRGVTIRANALDKPHLMKAYVARIDLTSPGIGFTATERDPDWGQEIAAGTNKSVRVGLSAERQEYTADFMERRRKEGKNVVLAVNTSGWGPAGKKPGDLYRWAVSDGLELSYNKNPSRGYFFIVRKDGTADIVANPPASITNEVAYAMYGNGFVLRDGKPAFDAGGAKYIAREPRMAFGLSPDRKTLVIVAVDGRQPGYSLGASYADLAEIFKREGCTDAINLDGGGSTSFVVFDEKSDRPAMLNRHAGGYVRKIALNFGITFDESACGDALELERTASILHSYEFAPVEDTPPPEGFVPFYASHYGRHGSRRLVGRDASNALAELDKAARKNLLTGEGRALRDAVKLIARASAGMEGQLTERGAAEQRKLARRMAGRFPEVFKGARRVRCQATDVHRVLASQSNFTMALKESAPELDFDFSTGPRYTDKLRHGYRRSNGAPGGASEKKRALDRKLIKTEGFMSRMFKSPDAVEKPRKTMRRLFACASNCQCLRMELGGLDIYRFFTKDEIAALARAMNAWHYMSQRNAPDFGDDHAWAAQWLARDIVRRADAAIADDRIAADLRFGHDTGLGPLVSLLGLEGAGDRVDPEKVIDVSPGWKWMSMASNFQMVFYRDANREVLAKILYNERETAVRGLAPLPGGPYYRWSDLKRHILEAADRMANL